MSVVAATSLVLAACTNSSSSAPPPSGTSVSVGSSGIASPTQGDVTVPSNTPSASSGSLAVNSQSAGLQGQYERVIKKVLPSIVQITTSVGLGSGVVYDNRGDIVTNDHVVGAATTFQVQLANSPHAVTATLVGTYPTDDLAVIKINAMAGLTPASFGQSSQLQVGQIVLAMGNPLGLTSSVTNGIVSALGRTLTEPTSADSPGATLPNSIQTSASINPGNSGGALVDLQGQVVGIPTLAATDAQIGGAAAGIGFAIPSDTVKSIAGQLITSGSVTNSGRAALGVAVQGITDAQGNNAGVGIVSVVVGKAAATAGLKAGDIILELEGQPVSSPSDLATILAGLKIGQIVPVVISRNGSNQTFRVTLGQL
jgi:putative serine protease PepD